LLSTLPALLDQSHLSDCTIVADGRKIRAHRLVLSGCSTFFSELFHTLESSMHPVIVLPSNTSFASLAALITFMYSGEVNVFEDQITKLLELAETLGIKGLTEINSEHMVRFLFILFDFLTFYDRVSRVFFLFRGKFIFS
jgi:hypothetical protein